MWLFRHKNNCLYDVFYSFPFLSCYSLVLGYSFLESNRVSALFLKKVSNVFISIFCRWDAFEFSWTRQIKKPKTSLNSGSSETAITGNWILISKFRQKNLVMMRFLVMNITVVFFTLFLLNFTQCHFYYRWPMSIVFLYYPHYKHIPYIFLESNLCRNGLVSETDRHFPAKPIMPSAQIIVKHTWKTLQHFLQDV